MMKIETSNTRLSFFGKEMKMEFNPPSGRFNETLRLSIVEAEDNTEDIFFRAYIFFRDYIVLGCISKGKFYDFRKGRWEYF